MFSGVFTAIATAYDLFQNFIMSGTCFCFQTKIFANHSVKPACRQKVQKQADKSAVKKKQMLKF